MHITALETWLGKTLWLAKTGLEIVTSAQSSTFELTWVKGSVK